MERTHFFSNMFQADTLSYKFINDEHIEKSVLRNTNIIGCTIQNSSFTGVDFNSSDFDGTIIMHCEFIHCDWARTDCCSITASHTIFNDIDFSLSTMSNCDFKQCTFINCKFEHIALRGSNFEQCIFKYIHLTQSSTYLNTYTDCYFDSCNINGNFYYNLLLHNKYIKSSFNKKLFAYNYFSICGKENLLALGLDYSQKEDIKTYLIQNNLLINLVILELNENNDVDMSIIRFIVAIGEILEIGLLVREEQLQFIHKFLEFLLQNDLISAVTIAEALYCLEKSMELFESQRNTSYEKCRRTINFIKNELYQAYQTMGQRIAYIKNEEIINKERIVKIVYGQEPQIPICSIINDIKTSLGIDAPDAVRIKTEIGSFHEWISCYDSILQCLQLFIAVIGLGYSMYNDRKKEAEKDNNDCVEKTNLVDTTSEQMVNLINKALSKQKINPEFSQTIQIVVKNDIIATKKFRGYSKSNVQSIDIITKSN